ncbi:Peptidoglycan/LPS O-acetylase OafA/YrhL, contains acyltransferase and SGNH-hydrolase domains [Mariprofundus ferrinatatus]|uniref:Peptidoglycan/LPS O-acetylase OafA/YrhL, contains acyltransferase and SGNH-hydrolase domains n=1 Tax=Mariprofundus ferrinatatus TaxID=1921087 RepID=A0A2K8L281_9PROT|nr:acyltransferase [Mariprofundus ferrinatatus]ATX81425.1 Peptidoglycan/LPS O-acetylase OafA/YrhL, contains acyltransferase and SGNH-hydrolase domains [Mariprofundus ferrinatatus]
MKPTDIKPASLHERNNFDLLRLLLAATVAGFHLWALTSDPAFSLMGRWMDASLAVDGFFVVSGFLVAMSYENSTSLKRYVVKRARRIYPAYLAVISLSALLLVLVSSAPLEAYFDGDWLYYLLSNLLFLNFLAPELPGVFENNRLHEVNGALWTIKIEVMFYLVLPLLVLFMRKIGHWRAIALIYIASVLYSMVMQWIAKHGGGALYLALERQLPGQLAFFMAGTLLFYYFDQFRSKHIWILLTAATVFFAAREWSFLYPFYPLALAVLIIWVATVMPCLGRWGRWGDFSYGIYIWHFPLIQLFVSTGMFDNEPYLGALMWVASLSVCAFLSWHLVERPMLGRSSHYRRAEMN